MGEVKSWMAPFVTVGLVTVGLVTVGLGTSGLVTVGLVTVGLVTSGLITVENERPLVTSDPPTPVISATFTVTLANGLVEVTKTLRDTEESAGMMKSRVVSGENC